MFPDLVPQLEAYAALIIHGGVDLQPGQAVRITAELAQRDFMRLLVAQAYDAGARHVDVRWSDPLTDKVRYQHIDQAYLGYLPEFEIARLNEMLDSGWTLIRLTGTEYPHALDDVDPSVIRRDRVARAQKTTFFQERVMNNEVSWCVAGAPTMPWAQQVFPDLEPEDALRRLWKLVLQVCRADQPDPLQAWRGHDARLKRIAGFLERSQVRAIRYLDETPGPDGRASSDLTVGLTDGPAWSCGSAITKDGRPFFANIPTEEVFSTPHRERARGWVRTSKPGFPFGREVSGATFRFQDGEVVEWSAETGQDVLDQLFEIPGARHLGELALVDVRSPINQSGLIFHDTLFDENAACHIAFGRGYPEGIKGGSEMDSETLTAMGLNRADTHLDLMIGTPAMRVLGITADGGEVLIMDRGQFVDEVPEGA
jgi:aminopeptidase